MMENLDQKTLQEILMPKPLNPLAQLWLSWHSGILKHPPKKEMLKLAELGIIPKELLYFKDKPAPICVSCAFGTAHKKQTRNKKGKRHEIRSKKDDAPGKCVSMDQLISAQPGLIPQFGGHLTRERIWAANVAVDHFTNVIKVALMKTTSQAETLDAKLATEKFLKDHGYDIER